MIEQAIKRFKLHIAIAVNPNKKYTFTEQERQEMLVDSLRERFGDKANDISVQVIPHLYLAKFAESKGVNLLLRGIRDQDDFKYERSMRNANAKICPNVDTLFMIPPRELEDVSSSFVKGMIGPEGWENEIVDFVPDVVYNKLLEKFNGSYWLPRK
jgi:pantetheine-phosphate adenylyltransferase